VLRRDLVGRDALVKRFFDEARAANSVGHPGIVDMIDVDTLPDGTPCLVMEYLQGESLARRIAREGRLGVEPALVIGWQIASVLRAAHDKGIVHRDLKPENLHLVPNANSGGPPRVKVLDFGVAKLIGDPGRDQTRTLDNGLTGTPIYMSPEQWCGTGADVDHRTDIYALGIVLHEMLCGTPPFVGEGFGDTMMKHMTVAAPPPSSLNPEVPPALDAVVLRALAKAREDRFASMRELQEALAAIWSKLTAQGRLSRYWAAQNAPPRPPRRSRWPFGIGG
jgi:serine/threonine-protein kinase